MKLHLDRDAFYTIISTINKSNPNYRVDILEKDYYVCLLLKELTERNNQAYAYFKGGTALYMALKSIRRFSEDIDLTIDVNGCTNNSQIKKRLIKAVTKFESLGVGEIIDNKKGSITCVYKYNSLFKVTSDPLNRFGIVKIEGTSFTISEPTNIISIAPQIYNLASDEHKKLLETIYDVKPFEIITISIERIFVDKLFAAEFYYQRNKMWDVAKHLYDLSILINTPEIIDLMNNKNNLNKIIEYKRKEELNRIGGIENNLKIRDFTYLHSIKDNDLFKDAFIDMQNTYVFNRDDRLSLYDVFSTIETILKNFI